MSTVVPKNANILHRYFLQKVGIVVLLLGIVILIGIGLYDFFSAKPCNDNALAAAGFFSIMISMAMLYPDMLKGPDNSTSSMRVAVFMIVSVFVVLAVKVYWICGDVSKFTLDRTWAYILGIALGCIAVQSFSENNVGSRKVKPQIFNTDKDTTPVTITPSNSRNTLFTSAASVTASDYHDSTVRQAPTDPPAPIAAQLKKA